MPASRERGGKSAAGRHRRAIRAALEAQAKDSDAPERHTIEASEKRPHRGGRRRQTFQGRSADTTWLIGIARHELLDHFRRQERDERRRIHLVRRAVETDEGEWQASDERQVLARALRALPMAQRMAVVLHYLDDLPVRSVADSMGRSVGAIESLLSRGRAKLRQQLGEDDDE